MAAPTVERKIFTAIGLDFETGGLDCTRCACTQIAVQAIRLDTLETFDRFTAYISPYDKQELGAVKRKVLKTKQELHAPGESMDYEKVALDYSGITMDMLISSGAELKQVATSILEFTKRSTLSKGAQAKPILIGQNILFDVGFLQQLMNYAGMIKEFEKVFAGNKDFYGNFQPHYIDTIDLGRMTFAADASVVSYKLELLAGLLGIELDDAHDADADVGAALDIVRICANRLRNNDAGSTGMSKQVKTRDHFKI